MNANINLENAVMIAGDYAYDRLSFENYRNHKYRGYGKDPDLDWLYISQQEKNSALWAVSAVTGIPQKVFLDMYRIEQRLIKKTQGRKCFREYDYQRLLCVLHSDVPGSGIYHNEYCDRAIIRQNSKK